MATISKSIDIDAPVEQVFAFFNEPSNLPEIWPSMLEVSNVERKADGNYGFDWQYKMVGIRFRGRSDSTVFEKNKRVVLKSETGIPNNIDYVYESVGNKTRLSMNVDYTVPGQVLGKLAAPIVNRINEHEAETVLQNLKVRMEMAKGAAVGAEATVH
jgi:uncharacterized membrane protein